MRKLIIVFILPFIIHSQSCNNSKKTDPVGQNSGTVALINEQKIFLEEIDSIISMQVFQLRMDALDVIISRRILMYEADRLNIELGELVEKEINLKSSIVTNDDIKDYYSQPGVSYIDTNYVKAYLKSINIKRRQVEYVDSIKQFYSLKRKLRPPYFGTLDGSNLFAHNLTENKSEIVVYIISDFSCPSCQEAKKILQGLYAKYNRLVNFKFVFYSEYVGELAMACEAAYNQKKFREMHDIIFSNSELLNRDSASYLLAKRIGLNMDKFEKDLNDNQILNKLIINRDTLVNNGIYSTPTFIVNGKILNEKYAIEYLEDVILEDLIPNKDI